MGAPSNRPVPAGFVVALDPPAWLGPVTALLVGHALAGGLIAARNLQQQGLEPVSASVLLAAVLGVIYAVRQFRRPRERAILRVSSSGGAELHQGGHALRCSVAAWRVLPGCIALSLSPTDGPSRRTRHFLCGTRNSSDEAVRRLRAWLTWQARGLSEADRPPI